METEAEKMFVAFLFFRAAKNPTPNPSRPAPPPCRRNNITHMTIEERRLVRDWLDGNTKNMRRAGADRSGL